MLLTLFVSVHLFSRETEEEKEEREQEKEKEEKEEAEAVNSNSCGIINLDRQTRVDE